MKGRLMTVEATLENLQRLVRRPPPPTAPMPAMSGQVPADLRTHECATLGLLGDELEAFEAVCAALAGDLRFEHLAPDLAKEATWRFACKAVLGRKRLVAAFVAEHAREPIKRTCFFPVEWLTVDREVELSPGVRLLPADAVEVPAIPLLPDPRPTMACAIAVACSGTNHERMRDRARAVAEHELRVLRAGLREDHFVHDRQLRFRFGETAWFDDRVSLWASRLEHGWELSLSDRLVELVTSQEIATLPPEAGTDVEARASLSLRWFERAQFESDPITKLLYLFYALETLVGDRSGGEKGTLIAVRHAMLEMATGDGSFSHPARAYVLYDKVRSAAVHGEQAPVIADGDVSKFGWNVRRAINRFLQYAREHGLTKRKQVTSALDADERRQELVARLLEEDPVLWKNLRRTVKPTG